MAIDKKKMIEGLTRLFRDGGNPLGVDVLNQPERFKSLVPDFIGGDLYKLERQIILFAYDADICPQILKAHKADDKERTAFKHIMFLTFTEKIRKRDDDAALAVEVYATALGWKETQSVQQTAPGDTYSFGNLNWRVLDVQDDRALLLTENIVEKRAYNIEKKDVTWEACSLRQYLNGEFYNCFASEDRVRILPCTNSNENTVFTSMTGRNINTSGGASTKDSVFLLSSKEAKRYFKTSDVHTKTFWNDHYPNRWSDLHENVLPEYTPQSDNLKATYKGKAWWWWLRSPGGYRSCAAFVGNVGVLFLYGDRVNRVGGGVRPALWLNLKS